MIAGQLSGVEGYTESIASGMLAGIYAADIANESTPTPAPRLSANGSLTHYITHSETKKFQPANITFDLLPPLEEDLRKKRPRQKGASSHPVRARPRRLGPLARRPDTIFFRQSQCCDTLRSHVMTPLSATRNYLARDQARQGAPAAVLAEPVAQTRPCRASSLLQPPRPQPPPFSPPLAPALP